jgi:hypothetical protein
MILQTTKGLEFEIDLETEIGYRNSRAIMEMLRNREGFKVFSSDELAINDLVNDINTLGICPIEELRVVCNHYYYILKQMKGENTIDELDMDVLMGKLVIDELNGRW